LHLVSSFYEISVPFLTRNPDFLTDIFLGLS
jgi:hypothetical protein